MRLANAFAILAVAASLSVAAAVPTKIGYQGYLASGGSPVNTTVSMTVKLYNHPTAATPANLKWSETQSVSVVNGVYSVVLGNTTLLDAAIFAVPLYLTVAVGGDADMTPRTPLASAPYAIRASALDGIDTTSGNLGLGSGAGVLVGGIQVVAGQQAAVSDAVNATGVNVGGDQVVTVAEFNALVARLNAALDRLRAHGLIAP